MAYTTIDKPTDYFNTVLYTGNTSGQSITGVGFQPDFLWIKSRSASYQHSLRNVIAGSTKTLRSNGTNAEATQSDSVTSFDSDGFTLGADSSSFVNENSATYASWNWKAGGSASSNSNGSITSSVSANTTAGFSIVSYTGTGSNATVGHGLGSAPNVIIWKKRSDTGVWRFWHHSVPLSGGEYQQGNLNSTDAFAPFGSTNVMNGTAPTSTVFSLDTADYNDSGSTYISYCFSEVKSFSKFGSYTGNGNADGTFVYTGFKPAWIMIKKTSGTGNWMIIDNKRSASGGFNVLGERIKANTSEAGSTADYQDNISNGFKIRTTASSWNDSGGTYIYMAFAESPFVNSKGVPNNAR